MKMHAVNVDGLIGPTYNFSALSRDNTAAVASGGTASNPRKAALQGLYKMKMLHDMGLKQAVLPPQERPDVRTLRMLGFNGSDGEVVARAFRDAPAIARACCSASPAWAANAATITPSCDSPDGRLHITPANLVTHFHRSIEPLFHGAALMALCPQPEAFCHHEPLPPQADFADEGAANQLRFESDSGEGGIHLFVSGARQSHEACRALARLHHLSDVLYAELNPDLVSAGIFHNDLVAMGHGQLLVVYEKAWTQTREIIRQLPVDAILVTEKELPLEDLLSSYLFNSQIVTLPDGKTALIAPVEARDNPRAAAVANRLPVDKVLYFDLSESMRNGGGPACLRIPLLVTDSEYEGLNPAMLMTSALYHELIDWVDRYYRETLTPQDLSDPALLIESRDALEELTQILDLGPLYPFQQL